MAGFIKRIADLLSEKPKKKDVRQAIPEMIRKTAPVRPDTAAMAKRLLKKTK